MILQQLRDDPQHKASSIIHDVRRLTTLDISYRQAWLIKEAAFEQIHGKDVDGYQEVYKLCEDIKKYNPGSIADVEVDPFTDRFVRLFISFRACMDGFRQACRPIIYIDGAFLKHKYKGTLLAASTKDANNELFVIAFAIASSENDENWDWFVQKLVDCVPSDRRYTIISDRSPHILKAVQRRFPISYHGWCIRHLAENFKKRVLWKNKARICNYETWIKKLYDAANATTRDVYDHYMNQIIEKFGSQAITFFTDAPPSHWANIEFPGPRWGDLTNNLAESFNAWITSARHLPITGVVNNIRRRLMERMHEQKLEGDRMKTVISPYFHEKIEKNNEQARPFVAIPSNAVQYEIVVGNNVYAVSLRPDNLSCSCNVWRCYGYPCAHACAAIVHAGASFHNFVDPNLLTEKYRQVHSFFINPISTVDRTAMDLGECEIRPPETTSQPGRRKTKRIPSQVAKRITKCSLCGQHDHNKRTCKNPIVEVTSVCEVQHSY